MLSFSTPGQMHQVLFFSCSFIVTVASEFNALVKAVHQNAVVSLFNV